MIPTVVSKPACETKLGLVLNKIYTKIACVEESDRELEHSGDVQKQLHQTLHYRSAAEQSEIVISLDLQDTSKGKTPRC